MGPCVPASALLAEAEPPRLAIRLRPVEVAKNLLEVLWAKTELLEEIVFAERRDALQRPVLRATLLVPPLGAHQR